MIVVLMTLKVGEMALINFDRSIFNTQSFYQLNESLGSRALATQCIIDLIFIAQEHILDEENERCIPFNVFEGMICSKPMMDCRIVEKKEKGYWFIGADIIFNFSIKNQNAGKIRQNTKNKPKKSSGVQRRSAAFSGAEDKKDIIFEKWQSLAKKTGLAQVSVWSESRKNNAKTLIKEFSEAQINQCFLNIERSSFLLGKIESSRAWRIDVDFLLKKTNFIKILEGKYNDKITNKPKVKIDLGNSYDDL